MSSEGLIDAVIFDMDGVLVDSLGPHVDFCHAVNKKYGFGIDLPPPEHGRKIAGNPMEKILMNAGFPRDKISEILNIYRNSFADNHPCFLFDEVLGMLQNLFALDISSSIATSNTRDNVLNALGNSSKYFHMIQTKDEGNKIEGISSIVKSLKASPERMLFVGDTLSDYGISKILGLNFLGVTYGWEITGEENNFSSVSTVHHLHLVILKMTGILT